MLVVGPRFSSQKMIKMEPSELPPGVNSPGINQRNRGSPTMVATPEMVRRVVQEEMDRQRQLTAVMNESFVNHYPVVQENLLQPQCYPGMLYRSPSDVYLSSLNNISWPSITTPVATSQGTMTFVNCPSQMPNLVAAHIAMDEDSIRRSHSYNCLRSAATVPMRSRTQTVPGPEQQISPISRQPVKVADDPRLSPVPMFHNTFVSQPDTNCFTPSKPVQVIPTIRSPGEGRDVDSPLPKPSPDTFQRQNSPELMECVDNRVSSSTSGQFHARSPTQRRGPSPTQLHNPSPTQLRAPSPTPCRGPSPVSSHESLSDTEPDSTVALEKQDGNGTVCKALLCFCSAERNFKCVPCRLRDMSGASTVAIDNKIEQAMDLVKSHLMFAVREEVEVLKEQIKELLEKNSQLEYEINILKANASPETLQKLAQVNPTSQQPPTTSS